MSSDAEPFSSLLAAWVPTAGFIESTNIAWLMRRVGAATYEELHAWSVQHRAAYSALTIERLGIRLQSPFSQVADFSGGLESPRWLVKLRDSTLPKAAFPPPATAQPSSISPSREKLARSTSASCGGLLAGLRRV